MNNKLIFRAVMVIIIIIGGVIIIIGRKPIPEPICIVCGRNILTFLGIIEVVLGAIALNLHNKIVNTKINVGR
ncbi:hypothetical protein E6C50_07715 [Flavobacterium supellecticarium]|uniref:Uncharacterized protein n=1 Tax=Flavobacterium supellecticarium TaxID=2565924 RepID=A0A4S4A0H5_9FLAO|nr:MULTISPECIES: hypothetical protein [Flavobacterium]THF51642.1 hypothetical protein E6C50_07715 [Flavobacterium supellecticarium]